jgi:ATP-dependent DNA ligase
MRFEPVAVAFEEIEKTTKRLDMTIQLATLFEKTPAEDMQNVIYLLQGRLAPAYENLETGLGEKLVIQAISKATGYPKEDVEKRFKKTGDLGESAAQFLEKKTQQSLVKQVLSVKKVHENFMKLATQTGEGTQETKIRLLAELLNSSTPSEGKFITRFALGALRLGVGDPTLMDALAQVHLKEFTKQNPKLIQEIEEKITKKSDEEKERKLRTKLREQIEAKYNIHSDLGYVATLLAEKGLKGLDTIDLEPGVPIRPTLAERLPYSKDIIEKLGKCMVEAKYDGFRCISGFTSIYEQTKGLIPVRDIQKGDHVLTHKGVFKKVIAKNTRKVDKGERVFRLQTYFGNDFKISEKHPVLTNRKTPKWVPIEKLHKTDEMIFPIPKFREKSILGNEMDLRNSEGYAKKIRITNEFFRFIGYWIGDGYTNDYHNTERVGIIFNAKTERNLCREYQKMIEGLFHVNTTINTHNGALYLYWRDAPFKKWLTTHFRREWKGKIIPTWFFGIEKDQFESFMKGWIESDGHTDEMGRTAITTKESDLAMRAQLLGLHFGQVIGIRKIRVKMREKTNTYCKLIVQKSERKARIAGGKLYIKILKLEELKRYDPRLTLYNIQVEGDESYCTNMATLHNCQIHKKGEKITIFSRNLESMTDMFPEIVEAAKKELKSKECIVEGEALAVNEETNEFFPFQITIQRKRKYDIEEKAKELPLKLFLFDVMYVDGKNVMAKPFHERRKILSALITGKGTIETTKGIITDQSKEIDQFFNENVSAGLEGIVCKDLNAPYIAGARKFAWIKLKRSYKGELQDSVDLVILGFYKGKGKRTEFGLGGLLAGVYDEERDEFKSITRIGTGFSEQMLQELHDLLMKHKVDHKPARVDSEIEPHIWVQPKFVIEVRADEITQSPMHTAGKETGTGYALRFPRILKLRNDKTPEQATSVKEILDMYAEQKRVKVEGRE